MMVDVIKFLLNDTKVFTDSINFINLKFAYRMLPREQRPSAPAGSAFGVTETPVQAPNAPRPTLDDLPEDIRRMLGRG